MLQDPILLHDWHPVASLAQLEQSPILSVRLLGEDLVVWRCGDQLLAWQDLCLHRGARLSLGWVRDERLVCPYHGWEYSADGQCVHIPAHPTQAPPAKARVKTYHAQVRYGLVWVALGEPHHPIPPFPEWEDAAFRKILCGPYR
ncbi:MAG: Rieske 2Fe-2S domain-containing protein, partial [Thermoflexales bacterium]|nr:Rieske 2Fe-2S domain-containing protein [Thermoflexales bacterium]